MPIVVGFRRVKRDEDDYVIGDFRLLQTIVRGGEYVFF
jgi:hypothetical protein